MADASFIAELIDKISGPAKRASRSTDKLSKSVKQMGGVTRGADGRLRALDTGKFVAGMKSSSSATERFQGDLSMVGAAAMKAAAAIAAVAAAAAGFLALKLGQAVFAAENLQFAFTKFVGSTEAAKKELTAVRKLSNQLGIDFQTAAGLVKNLISAGFTADQAKELVRFRADIVALGDGSERTAERVEEAFIQIEKGMATGRLEADGFNAILSNLPVTKMQVLEKLSKKTGIAVEKLAKTEVTKLPIKELIESFQEAALAATGAGKAGEVAIEKQMSTLSGMFAFAKNRIGNIFDDIAAQIGPKLTAKLLPLAKRFTTFLSSPEGEKAIAKVAAGVESVVDGVVTAIPVILKMGKALKSGFEAGIKGLEVFGPLFKAIAGQDDTSAGLVAVAKAIGFIAGAAIAGVVAIAAFIASIVQAVGTVVSFVTKANNLGAAIVKGIATGIATGASAVVKALGSVVDAAVSAAKAKLGIASPSKVFMQIGEFTGEGMAKGLDISAPSVNAAAAGLIRPQLPGSGGGVNTNVRAPISMTINAAADPEATAAAVRNVLGSELGQMFEQINVQVSA